jgi:hypothetical protein
MAVGDLILATDFNNMRSNIVSVLGQTSTGYGQVLRASEVAITNLVTSSNMQNLFLDMIATRLHQIGTVNSTIDIPLVGDIVGWDTSTDPNGVKKGIADFILLKNSIAAFDGSITSFPSGNFAVATASSSSRDGTTTPWGTVATSQTITHTLTFTFTDANHIEYYFNAGGQLRCSASLANPSGAKSLNWQGMLSAMGVVALDKWKTQSLNSSGTGSSIGYNTLTSTYQTVYLKAGSSVYAANTYKVEARKPTTTTVQIRITFNDLDTGSSPTSPVDETVLGTVTSLVQTYRPNSSFTYSSTNYTAVSIANPTTTVNTTL